MRIKIYPKDDSALGSIVECEANEAKVYGWGIALLLSTAGENGEAVQTHRVFPWSSIAYYDEIGSDSVGIIAAPPGLVLG